MRVWIDADACPKAAKDLIVKFALKRKFEVVMVAGQAVAKPAFAIVRLIVVPSGMDAADHQWWRYCCGKYLALGIRTCQ